MPCFSHSTSLRKRGGIDLNRTPSPEAEEDSTQFESSNAILNPSVHATYHNTQTHQMISKSTDRDENKAVKKRKKPVQTKEERRRKMSQYSSIAKKRKLEMVKEALEEPSKMTPDLQQWIKRYKERNRRNSAKSYARFKIKVKNNLPLTERDYKRIQAQNKTKEWRNWDPKNQARYEKHLEYNRKKSKQRREAKTAKEQQKGLQKRTVQFESYFPNMTMLLKRGNIDLNLPPPEEENSNDQATNDKEISQNISDMTKFDASQKNSKLKKSKKVKQTPEERKKRRTESSMKARRRTREKLKEALEDPSKMTPELLRWSEKYKAANRRGSAKHYARVKANYENNLPLTESAKNWFERTRFTKEWRNRHPDNQIEYEKHLKKRKDKRRQEREAKAAMNREEKSLQKRAFDLNKSPEPESDQSSTHNSQAENTSKKRKRTSSSEVTQMQKKPFNEIQGQKFKEAHPSQITPEIQKYIDRSEARRLASKRSFTELMEKKRNGEMLTPQQQKRYQSLCRTKEWRESSEINEERYKISLQRRKERYHKNKGKTIFAKGIRQSKTSFDIDDLSEVQRKIEEEKIAKKERNNRYYRQRMDRFKEARKDPSKMTPQLRAEMEKYYRKNNESTKRYQDRVKAEKAKTKKV